MVPYISVPTFNGGPAEVVKAYNERPSAPIGTKLTEADIKILKHLVLEYDEKVLSKIKDDLISKLLSSTTFDGQAREIKADAVINYSAEIQYKGFWLWKTPTYIKIGGDAVKIGSPHYTGEVK